MANPWARDRAGSFYLGFGLVALAAVFAGFSTTYFRPMLGGTFDAPAIVHLHGSLCFSWVTLFIVQALLVRNGASRLHRKAGLLGLPIAIGILASGTATAVWATRRDIATGPIAYATTIGTFTSLAIFLAFVSFALLMRRRPDWHKRLMMLATVVVLWPAYFRFRHLLPWIPRPDIWLAFVLADLPILVAALRDRVRYGRVHPVWAIFGTALVVEQAVEIWLFATPFWSALGKALFDRLS